MLIGIGFATCWVISSSRPVGKLFAWVLMTNHYHLVFKTPEPNLVEGMKWLQNTWTKRFNARHGMWGHVYGRRYKAVLVEENEDLESLRKNDWRKRVIGRAIRRNTTVPAAWISEQLRMGNVVRCAALTAKDPNDSWEPNRKQARAMLKKMEKEYRNID